MITMGSIFKKADDGKFRRIRLNCKLPRKDTNHAAKLWLAKPIINSKARAKSLGRHHGSCINFAGRYYNGFPLNPRRGIIVVSIKERLSTLTAQGEVFSSEDLAKVVLVGIDVSKIWAHGERQMEAVAQLGRIFPRIGALYLKGNFGSLDALDLAQSTTVPQTGLGC